MKVHPAAELFPLMQGEDFAALVESIREYGLKEPITLLDGAILDGRNRQRACEAAGVEPRYADADLNGAGPTDFVLIRNLHRRQLTPSQKAVAAAKALPMFAAEAKERQREAGRLYGERHPKPEVEVKSPQPQARARALVAKKFGVSDSQVGGAVALKKRAPDLFAQVEAGDLPVSTALRKTGLTRSGGALETRRPRNRHPQLMEHAASLARLGPIWNSEMCTALTPPQAKKQLTVLRKAEALLTEAIEAVEYRAATLRTFAGR